MRRSIHALSMIVAFAVGSAIARSETTNAPLAFYIVSDQKIDGGKFVDTRNLPKVGYISSAPDLVVSNLLDVYRENRATSAVVDGKVVPSHPAPGLAVVLRSDDAKRFTALTQKAVGKRLLVALGDRPLTAPKVAVPIETDRFSIVFANESELRKTQDDLKKLIPAG